VLKVELPRTASPPLQRRAALLALASPLLILLALVGLLHRTGTARWEVLPALLIGTGLLLTSLDRRRRRRKELLRALRQHPPG
jgi:hypothetical protein